MVYASHFPMINTARMFAIVDWALVGWKKRCDTAAGGRIWLGKILELSNCADQCKKRGTSMFIYGTTDGGVQDYCNKDEGCNCICESFADPDGTCEMIDDVGYNLYNFTKINGGKQLRHFF